MAWPKDGPFLRYCLPVARSLDTAASSFWLPRVFPRLRDSKPTLSINRLSLVPAVEYSRQRKQSETFPPSSKGSRARKRRGCEARSAPLSAKPTAKQAIPEMPRAVIGPRPETGQQRGSEQQAPSDTSVVALSARGCLTWASASHPQPRESEPSCRFAPARTTSHSQGSPRPSGSVRPSLFRCPKRSASGG